MSRDFIDMVSDLNERRFLRTTQSLANNKTPCGIFFAPGVPSNARQVLNYFKAKGINLNFICVLTMSQKKIIQPDENEILFALEEFQNLPRKPKFIFVLERFYGTAFMNYFKAFDTNMFFLPDVENAENQYNFYMKHLSKLYDVHEMLVDDKSKKIFRAAITGRITRLMQDFIYTTEHEYFLSGFLPKEGDIAIDGGSFDGGTSADFVRQGAKVYAFEMDENHYKNCLAPAEKFGFTIENLGLSDKETEAAYVSSGWGSHKIMWGGGIVTN